MMEILSTFLLLIAYIAVRIALALGRRGWTLTALGTRPA